VYHTKSNNFQDCNNGAFLQFNKWFEVNILTSDFAKQTPTIHMYEFKLGCCIKTIKEIHNTLKWELILKMLSPNVIVCTAMRAGTSIMTTYLSCSVNLNSQGRKIQEQSHPKGFLQ
jgi:hypothetical protein